MKTLSKLATLFAFAALTSNVFAEPAGEAVVRAAAEGTVTKIEEAVSLTEKGAASAEIVKVINDARQLQKEFRYEGTERQRQKANDKLRIAREAFEANDKATAEPTLKAALGIYQEMLKVYNANH